MNGIDEFEGEAPFSTSAFGRGPGFKGGVRIGGVFEGAGDLDGSRRPSDSKVAPDSEDLGPSTPGSKPQTGLRLLRGAFGQKVGSLELVPVEGHDGERTEERLERELAECRADLAEERQDRLELTSRMVRIEREAARVREFCLAIHQLHLTLDAKAVQATIGEIAAEFLAARSFVLLLRQENASWRIALVQGVTEETPPEFRAFYYEKGCQAVDSTLADDVLRVEDEGATLAAIPLRANDATTIGVLAILESDQPAESFRKDRDFLELFGAHAGSALELAEANAAADRKFRTLQGLVSLCPAPSE